MCLSRAIPFKVEHSRGSLRMCKSLYNLVVSKINHERELSIMLPQMPSAIVKK